MNYSDDILNVYAYLFSKSQKNAEASKKAAEKLTALRTSVDETRNEAADAAQELSESIAALRRMAAEMGIDVSDIPAAEKVAAAPAAQERTSAKIHLPEDFDFEKDFDRLVEEAHAAGFTDVHPEELLSAEEIAQAQEFSDRLDADFAAATGLSRGDIAIITVAVVVRVMFFLLLQGAQPDAAPLGEVIPRSENIPEKIPDKISPSSPSPGGIDATEGVDIGGMLRDMPPGAKAAAAAATTLDHFTGSYLPIHILDSESILTMKKPFDLQSTDRFSRSDIVAYNKMLGWVIGVVNLLTNTVTTFNLKSYSVNRRNPMAKPFADKEVSTIGVLRPVLRNLSSHKLSVIAAVIQEALTLGFGNATHEQVHTLFTRSLSIDSRTTDLVGKAADVARLWNLPLASYIGGVAMISLVNTIISALHAMLYDEKEDGPLDMYSIRTGKIILISGAISTTLNSLPALAARDFKNMDYAGILTTCFSLFQSTKFWLDVKISYLCSEHRKVLEREMENIDKYFE